MKHKKTIQKQSSRLLQRCSFLFILMAATALSVEGPSAHALDLKVKVIKACETCKLPAAPGDCQSSKEHWDQAATWVPETDIRIHAVSIPEQSEVSIYTDIEVSLAPQMYLPYGHIFRVKYAGPGIVNGKCPYSFVGSNVTTTNIVFPMGLSIPVSKGIPIYLHMDVINWSPFEIEPMAQDVYIYYTESVVPGISQ
jgi:hypothetical protein